ncbi:MAG: hypothetical protein DRH57_04265 [Candidatus Cloacimonadota bacterium]|nr:MAG: hypothetical protein DRH57_04265 [Candidatus Cloacimonadota bacterium]
MKRIILISGLVLFILPCILCADVEFLTEKEYKDLSKTQRLKYWEDLENELAMWQQRDSQAQEEIEKVTNLIEELKAKKSEMTTRRDNLYNEIIASAGKTLSDVQRIHEKIKEYKNKVNNYQKLSNKELYRRRKDVESFTEGYWEFRENKLTNLPEFDNAFQELDRSIRKLSKDLIAARPKYYEDDYVVVKNDYLSKISGYDHIYNDPKKWGIIYRANRDKIKDPDLIYIDQILKIPRGLPTSWKVYRGEYLSKISAYPEIYNNALKWPVIYNANKDQIKDPDLIYPNQILRIPRD